MTALPDLSGLPNASKPLPTQYPAIPDPTQDPAAMLLTLQRLKESVELLTGQRTQRLSGMNQAVFELRSQNGDLAAMIRQVDEVSTSNNEALAQRTLTLEADYADASARITTVDTARVNGDYALAQRASTLEAQMGQTSAWLSQVDQARVDGDNALASRTLSLEAKFGPGGIVSQTYATLVQFQIAQASTDQALSQTSTQALATANGATASGQVGLVANAGLGGTYASYSWVLNAYGQSVGMYANVGGDGVANIAFNSYQFRLYDPGRGPVPVFEYIGGGFTFNGNVTINGNLIVNGSVGSGQIADGAISQIAASSGWMSTGAGFYSVGAKLLITVVFNGAPMQRFSMYTPVGGINVYLDGMQISGALPGLDTYPNPDPVFSFLPTTIVIPAYVGAGYHSVTAYLTNGAGVGGISVTVTELRR